jgi:F-type H+-transporting ATPase subunit delta
MARTAVARRYAKALFQLASEEGRSGELREELAALTSLLGADAELRSVLLEPLHPVEQRKAVLEGVAAHLGSSPVLRNFYAFLINQRRLVDIDGIHAEYERLADEAAGLTRALVRAASPLRDDQLARLRQALAGRTGRQVELEVEIDESLLGGVVAQVGDLVFDGSLRSQLDQLRGSLVRE